MMALVLASAARWLCLSLLFALTGWVAIAAVNDGSRRPGSPDAMVRSYFLALEAGDAERALGAIAPTERARWRGFVENGVFNQYIITGIAIRQASLLERLLGAAPLPYEATLFLDITPWTAGARWQATPRVALRRIDEQWFMLSPPLAPG